MSSIGSYVPEIALGASLLATSGALLIQARRITTLKAELEDERRRAESTVEDLRAVLGCSENIHAHLRSFREKNDRMVMHIKRIGAQSETASTIEVSVTDLVERGVAVNDIAKICNYGEREIELLNRLAESRSAA